MTWKKKRAVAQQIAQRAVLRDTQNQTITFAATHTIKEVPAHFDTAFCGLETQSVISNRTKYGSNRITKEKKKSLPNVWQRLLLTPLLPYYFV